MYFYCQTVKPLVTLRLSKQDFLSLVFGYEDKRNSFGLWNSARHTISIYAKALILDLSCIFVYS